MDFQLALVTGEGRGGGRDGEKREGEAGRTRGEPIPADTPVIPRCRQMNPRGITGSVSPLPSPHCG